MRFRQRSDGGPILLAAPVNNHARDVGAFGEQFSLPATETLGLQVVVGVVEDHSQRDGLMNWKA